MVSFGRLGFLLDRLPYPHAPLLEAALGHRRFVLDLGGGTGRVARQLVYERVVVADPEIRLLERARRRHLDAVRCDARFLPFKDGSIPGAFAVDALHHIPDHGKVFAEARRVLAPAGRFVVEEFDPGRWQGRLVERLESWLGFGSEFRRPSELLELARKAGFEARAERWSRRDYAVVAERPAFSKS